MEGGLSFIYDVFPVFPVFPVFGSEFKLLHCGVSTLCVLGVCVCDCALRCAVLSARERV